ncbi:helicase associated domain-containing protein [Streptomyces sp. NPDC059849]|uniref:helicase associated domain-containing protein n=1 Tax=Streptomyces sp. NPDC059849 TaxID=3346969 RepID=UPI003646707E
MISAKKRHPQTSRPTPPRTRAHTVSTNPGYPQHTPRPVPQLHPPKRHEPAGKDGREERAGRGYDAKWALGPRAARAFHAREGYLRVPRKHVEHLAVEPGASAPQGSAGEAVMVRLGTWIDNARRRGDKLTEARRADLDALDMRW